MAEHECPMCQGQGKFQVLAVIKSKNAPADFQPPSTLPCKLCQGSGKVDDKQLAACTKGAEAKQKRLAAGYGLREYAEMIGMKPSDLCNMENGRLIPEES